MNTVAEDLLRLDVYLLLAMSFSAVVLSLVLLVHLVRTIFWGDKDES